MYKPSNFELTESKGMGVRLSTVMVGYSIQILRTTLEQVSYHFISAENMNP